jgi:hypothetical protein
MAYRVLAWTFGLGLMINVVGRWSGRPALAGIAVLGGLMASGALAGYVVLHRGHSPRGWLPLLGVPVALAVFFGVFAVPFTDTNPADFKEDTVELTYAQRHEANLPRVWVLFGALAVLGCCAVLAVRVMRRLPSAHTALAIVVTAGLGALPTLFTMATLSLTDDYARPARERLFDLVEAAGAPLLAGVAFAVLLVVASHREGAARAAVGAAALGLYAFVMAYSSAWSASIGWPDTTARTLEATAVVGTGYPDPTAAVLGAAILISAAGIVVGALHRRAGW